MIKKSGKICGGGSFHLILICLYLSVHHLHGALLPVQDGLHGGRGGVALRPHGDHNVRHEPTIDKIDRYEQLGKCLVRYYVLIYYKQIVDSRVSWVDEKCPLRIIFFWDGFGKPQKVIFIVVRGGGVECTTTKKKKMSD